MATVAEETKTVTEEPKTVVEGTKRKRKNVVIAVDGSVYSNLAYRCKCCIVVICTGNNFYSVMVSF